MISYTVREAAAAVRKYPTSARAHFKLGLAFYKERKYKQSIAELLEAQRLDPHRLIVQYWLGYSYHAQGDSAAAARVFERLVRIPMPGRDLGDTYVRLGNYYGDLGKTGEAARCYRVALQHDPCHHAASFALGTIAAREDRLAEARTYFELALKTANDGHARATALARLGELSEEQGDTTSALASYSAALKADPGRSDATDGLRRLGMR